MTLVILSLGSNIERDRNIRYAVAEIEKRYGAVDRSPVYETSSVGFQGPAFYNLVVGFESDAAMLDIRAAMREIESGAGRERGRKTFESRVLDIDILLYGEQNLRPYYNIPRDEIERYAYVLKPLADLYPELRHPVSGETISQMWRQFESAEQMVSVAGFSP